jgi:hypothetical protein
MRKFVCAVLGCALVVGGLDAQDRTARDAGTRDAARTRDAGTRDAARTRDAATRDAARTRDAATRDAATRDAATRDATRTRDAAVRDAARDRDARVTDVRRRDRDNERFGRVRHFDREARRLTVRMPNGRTRTFRVTRSTRVIGPRGTALRKGLRDSRLQRGARVRIVTRSDGRTAREIRLGMRRQGSPRDRNMRDR